MKKYPFLLSAFLVSLLIFRLFYNSANWFGHATIQKDSEVSEVEEFACGEECSYSKGQSISGLKYPLILKRFVCPDVFRRWAYANFTVAYPPPKKPPSQLYNAFTMNGKCPLGKNYYLIGFKPNVAVQTQVWTSKQIQDLVNLVRQRKVISSYRQRRLEEAVEKWIELVKDKHALVVGTIKPWVEAILLNYGVSRITTAEYNVPDLRHPKITVIHPRRLGQLLATNAFHDKFDVVVSYSSLEHSGLGRYGDPLNPYGDMEAMAQIWCMTKPNGHMLLNVPMTGRESSHIQWNAHRVYGWNRLEHLTANWKVLDIVKKNVIVLKRDNGKI